MGKRFERIYVDFIKDNQTQKVYGEFQLDDLVNLLNERIKQLEEQLSTATMYHGCNALINELKANQNSKAIEVLERAKIEFETYYADNIWNYPEWIDNQITELRN